MMTSRFALLLAVGALWGCAERTIIRSSPSDARVYFQDRFVGMTPLTLKVPRDQFSDNLMVRLERDGYEPQQVPLSTQVAPGRAAGAVFSLGISAIFKRPTAFEDRYDVELRPVRSAGVAQPTRAQSLPPNPDPAVADRLRKIQSLYDHGLISEEEYRRYRREALGNL